MCPRPSSKPSVRPVDWTPAENRLIVAEYFEFLRRFVAGQDVRLKKPAYDRLVGELGTREAGAIENKFQNMSAVLELMGWRTVPGWPPRPNFQVPLAEAVRAHVHEHPDLLLLLEGQSSPRPSLDEIRRLASPDREVGEGTFKVRDRDSSRLSSTQQKIVSRLHDLDSDSRRREIGQLGEAFVLELEQRKLERANRSDLARQVEWSARDIGDGLGYDVRSFTPEGTEIFIEVKSTSRPMVNWPFFISANEVEVSRRLGPAFRLGRVFDLFSDPRVRTIAGPVPADALTPVTYRGVV